MNALWEIVQTRLVRRGVAVKNFKVGDREPAAGGTVRRVIEIQQGIPIEAAREIVKFLKDQKLKKVQATIQADQVRVSSPSKDELQDAMRAAARARLRRRAAVRQLPVDRSLLLLLFLLLPLHLGDVLRIELQDAARTADRSCLSSRHAHLVVQLLLRRRRAARTPGGSASSSASSFGLSAAGSFAFTFSVKSCVAFGSNDSTIHSSARMNTVANTASIQSRRRPPGRPPASTA